jgi:pimeloyl-ACP methyl ester carboxylesterase
MLKKFAIVLSLSAASLSPAVAAVPEKPAIVLVHGAFADAASWSRVIPILQRDGYEVTAVENPLASLDSDVAWTKRIVDAQTRPVVLVGHSYGGAVITGAAADDPKVKALVYVAAFAPEAGEPVGAFGEKYPVKLSSGLRPDSAGFLYIDRSQFRELFAADLPEAQTAVLAASQKPVNSSVFGASVPQAAWKSIPSWYIVATEDHAINPDLERFYAKRIKAKTVEIKSSHVPFVSNPAAVARVIEEAANAPAR